METKTIKYTSDLKLPHGFTKDNNIGYLWYSQTEYERLSNIYNQEDHWGKLENGDVVLYTDFSKEPQKQDYMPHDAELLGLGAWLCNGSLNVYMSPTRVVKLKP